MGVMGQQSYLFIFLIITLYILRIKCQKIDPNSIQNSWIPTIAQNLESFTNEILEPDKIRQLFQNEIDTDTVSFTDANQLFQDIFTNITYRLDRVNLALKEFKKSIEDEISGPASPVLNPPFRDCCLPPPSPRKYEGRVRQSVDLSDLCTGTTENRPFQEKLWNSFNILKRNYNDVPAILWLYFTTKDGQFIQYPSKNRYCNGSKIISPITEQWFVDKHFMRQKNVVIVFNTGYSTSATMDRFKIHEIILESISRTLDTFTAHDKINVVAFNDTAYVPESCSNRLFEANRKNIDIIKSFIKTKPKGTSDYTQGLKTAYSLFEWEKQHSSQFMEFSNILILVTDSDSASKQSIQGISNINKSQELNGAITHIVFAIGKETNQSFTVLKTIAEQQVSKSVGSVGFVKFLTNESNIPLEIATYYKKYPPSTATEINVIAPLPDKNNGMIMTSSIPVVNGSSVYGVAALDVSMATLFSEIVDFHDGVHNYAFLLEMRHGHVLLHPKLKDPDENKNLYVVFPQLEALEPDLSIDQIITLKSCSTGTTQQFLATIRPGRSSYMSGFSIQQKLKATITYSKITGTEMCVVVVLFDLDKWTPVSKTVSPGKKFHAPYHRIDEIHNAPTTNKPTNGVCSLDGKFVAFQESTVKLSPFVYEKPETYKFEKESSVNVHNVNDFLENSRPTSLIKKDIQNEIQVILKATDTLDDIWKPKSNNIIERFLGTSTGVFRNLPGTPLPNVYNHIQHLWYKRSVGKPSDIIVTPGKMNQYSKKSLIVLSKALSDNVKTGTGMTSRELQGVIGATITRTHLSALLLNNIGGCKDEDIECHVLDEAGYLLLTENRHISHSFPWMATDFLKRNLMKPKWCTMMSDGVHKLSYQLTLDFASSLPKGDYCRQYVIGKINDTNLYVLFLQNRTKYSCKENHGPLEFCGAPGPESVCTHCIHDLGMTCQQPCQCDSDFDQCSSQFNDAVNSTEFPYSACYYDPLSYTPEHPDLHAASTNPVIPLCQTPCIYMESRSECLTLTHCKWTDADLYPMCVWKNETETTTANELTTKSVLLPQTSRKETTKITTIPSALKTSRSSSILVMSSVSSHHKTDTTTLMTTHQITSSPGGITEHIKQGNDSDDTDPGLIVGIVIVCVVVLAVLVFLGFKLYRKKFKRTSDRGLGYATGSSLFDGALFRRGTENTGEPSTTVPYDQM